MKRPPQDWRELEGLERKRARWLAEEEEEDDAQKDVSDLRLIRVLRRSVRQPHQTVHSSSAQGRRPGEMLSRIVEKIRRTGPVERSDAQRPATSNGGSTRSRERKSSAPARNANAIVSSQTASTSTSLPVGCSSSSTTLSDTPPQHQADSVAQFRFAPSSLQLGTLAQVPPAELFQLHVSSLPSVGSHLHARLNGLELVRASSNRPMLFSIGDRRCVSVLTCLRELPALSESTRLLWQRSLVMHTHTSNVEIGVVPVAASQAHHTARLFSLVRDCLREHAWNLLDEAQVDTFFAEVYTMIRLWLRHCPSPVSVPTTATHFSTLDVHYHLLWTLAELVQAQEMRLDSVATHSLSAVASSRTLLQQQCEFLVVYIVQAIVQQRDCLAAGWSALGELLVLTLELSPSDSNTLDNAFRSSLEASDSVTDTLFACWHVVAVVAASSLVGMDKRNAQRSWSATAVLVDVTPSWSIPAVLSLCVYLARRIGPPDTALCARLWLSVKSVALATKEPTTTTITTTTAINSTSPSSPPPATLISKLPAQLLPANVLEGLRLDVSLPLDKDPDHACPVLQFVKIIAVVHHVHRYADGERLAELGKQLQKLVSRVCVGLPSLLVVNSPRVLSCVLSSASTVLALAHVLTNTQQLSMLEQSLLSLVAVDHARTSSVALEQYSLALLSLALLWQQRSRPVADLLGRVTDSLRVLSRRLRRAQGPAGVSVAVGIEDRIVSILNAGALLFGSSRRGELSPCCGEASLVSALLTSLTHDHSVVVLNATLTLLAHIVEQTRLTSGEVASSAKTAAATTVKSSGVPPAPGHTVAASTVVATVPSAVTSVEVDSLEMMLDVDEEALLELCNQVEKGGDDAANIVVHCPDIPTSTHTSRRFVYDSAWRKHARDTLAVFARGTLSTLVLPALSTLLDDRFRSPSTLTATGPALASTYAAAAPTALRHATPIVTISYRTFLCITDTLASLCTILCTYNILSESQVSNRFGFRSPWLEHGSRSKREFVYRFTLRRLKDHHEMHGAALECPASHQAAHEDETLLVLWALLEPQLCVQPDLLVNLFRLPCLLLDPLMVDGGSDNEVHGASGNDIEAERALRASILAWCTPPTVERHCSTSEATSQSMSQSLLQNRAVTVGHVVRVIRRNGGAKLAVRTCDTIAAAILRMRLEFPDSAFASTPATPTTASTSSSRLEPAVCATATGDALALTVYLEQVYAVTAILVRDCSESMYPRHQMGTNALTVLMRETFSVSLADSSPVLVPHRLSAMETHLADLLSGFALLFRHPDAYLERVLADVTAHSVHQGGTAIGALANALTIDCSATCPGVTAAGMAHLRRFVYETRVRQCLLSAQTTHQTIGLKLATLMQGNVLRTLDEILRPLRGAVLPDALPSRAHHLLRALEQDLAVVLPLHVDALSLPSAGGILRDGHLRRCTDTFDFAKSVFHRLGKVFGAHATTWTPFCMNSIAVFARAVFSSGLHAVSLYLRNDAAVGVATLVAEHEALGVPSESQRASHYEALHLSAPRSSPLCDRFTMTHALPSVDHHPPPAPVTLQAPILSFLRALLACLALDAIAPATRLEALRTVSTLQQLASMSRDSPTRRSFLNFYVGFLRRCPTHLSTLYLPTITQRGRPTPTPNLL